MELTHLNQIALNELRFEKIDCIIACTGNQPRAYSLAGKIHSDVSKKILLVPPEEEMKKHSNYIEIFKEYGFSNRNMPVNCAGEIDKLLTELCNIRTHQVNIILDYSCMPKKWYATVIDSITRNNFPPDRINLFLCYTPKIFDKKGSRHSIGYLGPIILDRDGLNDKKPVSMIAALDHHHNTVLEAISKVKPGKFMAFVPHCTHDPEYTQLVLENNKTLLNRLNRNNIITYEADRPEEINTLLTSYCLDERISSEVMIVPQGPKTFSMMSILLSIRYPDVKLWEIILKDSKISPGHGHPAANPVIVKVSFVNDELD
jgi:hypothetical protein